MQSATSAYGAPIPRDRDRTDRPGTARPILALTPCMSCSFGLLPHPRSGTYVQPTGLLRVTVIVRWIPLVTAAYGTPVAPPARTTMLAPDGDGSQLNRRVRPVPGDHCVVAESRRARGCGESGSACRRHIAEASFGAIVASVATGPSPRPATSVAQAASASSIWLREGPAGRGAPRDRSRARACSSRSCSSRSGRSSRSMRRTTARSRRGSAGATR